MRKAFISSYRDQEYIENRLMGTAPGEMSSVIQRLKIKGMDNTAAEVEMVTKQLLDNNRRILRWLRTNGWVDMDNPDMESKDS